MRKTVGRSDPRRSQSSRRDRRRSRGSICVLRFQFRYLFSFPPSDLTFNWFRHVVYYHATSFSRMDRFYPDCCLPPSQSTLDEYNGLEEGASPSTLIQSSHDEHLDRSFTRRLPTEILGYILILTLPDHEYIQPNIRSSPLVLGRVCNA